MKQKQSISMIKQGMSKDTPLSQQKNTSYSFALNANTQNETNGGVEIQNEPSNTLGITFKNGYKVIGFKNNNIKDRTYYILTNPITKKSSIGYVDNIINETFNQDIESECPTCEYKNILGQPLETTVQIDSLTYVELLNDNCHIDAGREGLNLDINFPIKKIEIKQEKLGTTIYWNDNRNPKRYANVTNIEQNPTSHYLLTQEVPCSDDILVDCILIDKLLAYPKHNKIQIEAEMLQIGGNLKMGTYEFRAVYCDLLGNEMTNYSTPTNPVSIFDENNNILSQTQTDAFTNFAIKLKVNNLDSKAFRYYKVVCTERNNVDNSQTSFVEGIHPTTDDTVVYTSSGSLNDDVYIATGNVSIKKRIDLNTLNIIKPTYDKAKGTMVSGGIMWDYGLTKREELNLQSVVNLFSSLIEWQTSAAKEDLYKNAIATSKYKGYMRNEVQPFGIRFFYKDGDYSAVFPVVGRPALASDLTVVSDINYNSINANTPACGVNTRNKKWQIFNTATVTESCSSITTGTTTEEAIKKSCIIENVEEVPTNTITIQTETTFEGLIDYIKYNPTIVIPEITPYIEAVYPSHCTSDFGTNCILPATLIDSYNEISTILTAIPSPLAVSPLVVGENYLIKTLIVGDDFTNVGFIAINTPFIATGTTPTVWTNGTIVITPLIIGEQYLIQTLAIGDNFTNIGFTTINIPFVAISTIPTTWVNGTVVYKTKESTTYIEKDLIEYKRALPSQATNFYKRETTTGAFIRDTTFENSFMTCFDSSTRNKVYKRESPFYNENCSYSEAIIDNTSVGYSYFLNYAGDLILANLLTTYAVDATTVTTNFQNKLHKKALFFTASKNGRNKLILEITQNSECSEEKDNLEDLQLLRYTIYKNCSDFTVLGGGIIDTTVGKFIDLDTTLFPNTFLIAIDSPIKSELVEDNCATPVTPFTVYKILPPCGVFSIFTRDIETKEVDVTWTKIILNKIENYQSQCTFSIPDVDECNPKPYIRGDFSYWESTETYPDNNQLYNSSTLKIKPSDLANIPIAKKDIFNNYFTNAGAIDVFGNYIWKEDIKESTGLLAPVTDLTCRPIRHPKFPDNTIAPFMYDSESQQKFAETIIFPLGITIDSTIVTTMLQVAKNNGIITQKEFDNIEGYEILRGDNTIHKSVIANGLGFDMYKYEKEDKEEWWYANFPFNDLGDDKFHTSDEKRETLINHPNSGNSNHLYSFLSPDIFLTKPSIPTEVVLTGYQFGNATESIVDVKDHPKYTILGQDARRLATTLAEAELILETLIKAAEMSKELTVGWTSINIGGIISSVIVFGGYAIQGYVKIGRYRYEWLKTFRDLGATYNFAAMTVGVGSYNKFLKVDSTSTEYLRGLSVRKYIRDGMFNTTDKSDGKRLNINNWLREDSVLLSTGKDYKFNYPLAYKNYDNNKTNSDTSSKVLASDIGCKTNLNSIRNVASPYFSLKNYIPDQWGTIDSIKWLTTNYMFKLADITVCEPIFGGTVCISPFSWRRKTPLFRSNAMNTADKLPFSYSEYNNIGYTKYYLDYEIDAIYKAPLFKIPFPDIKSNYAFDCETGRNDFYVKPPSKMYLYSYGIVNFLVESEINCHFRYARKDSKDWFYPQVSNVEEWVQEKNLSISEPNTFFYNNSYSFPVSNTPYKFLDYTYDKEVWKKRNEQPNAVIYTEQDNNENSLTDPWLVNKPANWYEFETKFGKLIDLKDIESSQFFARFENQLILHNAIDNLADRINPQNKDTGTAGIFAKRPTEFKTTDLGFAGTQNTDICSTPYGHFWADAKRGRIFQIDQNGKDLQIISEQVGNQPTNMKQWFREHLPFKILKQFPNVDIDNKFKGLGMNIYYDDRFSRVFFTKRDYIAKNSPCLKFEEGVGFYDNCANICPPNFTYNIETDMCEEIIPADCCLADFTIIVDYLETGCAVGHNCNGASFNLLGNEVNIGIAYLSNTGGSNDHFNRPLGETTGNHRTNSFTLTTQQAQDISQASLDGNITFKLTCAIPITEDAGLGFGVCHTSASHMRIIRNGEEIYNSCPNLNTFTINPCTGEIIL